YLYTPEGVYRRCHRLLCFRLIRTTPRSPLFPYTTLFRSIFAVFGINFPVGVLVYWLTTNVWTMGQQMYVIHNNPTPGSKAQAAYLERLSKHVLKNSGTRNRRQRAIIKAIVAKGRDRNEYERKFINGLSKNGLVAQADGAVVKGEATVHDEDGTQAGTPKRQQPKRQSKSQRQSGVAKAADEPTSLTKSDESQSKAKTAAGAKKGTGKQPGGATRSKAQSGQRKGPQ